MRKMTDKNGLEVQIEYLRGEDAYAGLLEGTPYLARKLRLLQGRRMAEYVGTYVDGLDALEREIAELENDCEIWAPNERWDAKLITATDWPSCLRRYLRVHWYQEGGDPFGQLAEIVRVLDFARYCASEKVDQD